MKVERFVPGLFALIGLGLLIVSVFIYLNTRSFINSSARATGTVIAHASSRSTDGAGEDESGPDDSRVLGRG
jgi:hypothetical protein